MRNEGMTREGGRPKVIILGTWIAVLVVLYSYQTWVERSLAGVIMLVVLFEVLNTKTFEWDNGGFRVINRLSKNKNYGWSEISAVREDQEANRRNGRVDRWSEISAVREDQVEFHVFTNKESVRLDKRKISKELTGMLIDRSMGLGGQNGGGDEASAPLSPFGGFLL